MGKNIDQDDKYQKQVKKTKKPWYQITPYLDEVDIENVLNYKFHGGCDAWLYLHFWSPLADWLVSMLPRNLAANIVTLFGFFFTIMPMIWLFSQFGTTFQNPSGGSIPGWMFIVQSVSYFLARLIDEMDGKQARRLKNGSILGLLVDHGCDGYAMGFFAMILLKLVQGGDTVWALVAMNTSTCGFYVSTLEHYYSQNHFMGNGNMVTDGSFAVVIVFAALGFTGNDVFGEYYFKEYTNGNIFSFALGFVGFCNVLAYGYGCITHKPSQYTIKEFNGLEFFWQILGFVFMSLVTSTLLFMGDKPLMNFTMHNQPVNVHPGPSPLVSIILIQNFLMAHLNFSIIINHVSSQIYNPFKNKLMIFTCLYVLGVYINVKANPDFDIINAIYILFCLNFVFALHKLVSLARQIKEVLCIPFFFTYDPEERDRNIAEKKKLN